MSFANKMAPCCYMMLLSPTIVPLYDSLAQVTGKPACNASVLSLPQAPVVQTLDSATHRINHYPADNYYGNQLRYPLDSDLSGG